jgi:protein involved in polysaccharide export with SLBB domain
MHTKVRVSIIRALIAMTVFFISAASARNGVAQGETQKKPADSSAHASAVLDSAHNAADEQVFRAGEAILISTFPDTLSFLRGMHRVDDDGCVDLPIIGRVRVSDKTEKQLVDTLVSAYVNYLRYPILQVRPLIRVSLLGGFYRPGLYWVPPTSSLWDVVFIAGGTLRDDGIKKIRWERSKVLVKKDVVEDFQSGISLQKIGFVSGDQLWATAQPRQRFWETMRTDIIPILSISVSLVYSSIMSIQMYNLYKQGR